jgi:hypothetical protein
MQARTRIISAAILACSVGASADEITASPVRSILERHADRTLKPGDTFFNPRGSIHSLLAAPGAEGGIAVSTWIVDKDKPLATSVNP